MAFIEFGLFNFFKLSAVEPLFKRLTGSATKPYERRLESIEKIVCENQGELAQYSFLAGEKHKKVKDHFRNAAGEFDINLDELKRDNESLEGFLNNGLESITMLNLHMFVDYFKACKKHSNYLPRLCIKVADENGNIVKIFVDRQLDSRESGDLDSHSLESSTAVSTAKARGKIYHCENIPKHARTLDYKNSRLNVDCANRYDPEFWYTFHVI